MLLRNAVLRVVSRRRGGRGPVLISMLLEPERPGQKRRKGLCRLPGQAFQHQGVELDRRLEAGRSQPQPYAVASSNHTYQHRGELIADLDDVVTDFGAHSEKYSQVLGTEGR